jgi:hypothetical protein
LIVVEGLNVMMKDSLEANIFKAYLIGDSSGDHVHISQLQFADDTLIIGEKTYSLFLSCNIYAKS